MKPRSRIKPSRHKGGGKSAAAKKRNPRSSSHGGGDPFFESDPKRRRRAAADEDLESLPSDDDDVYGGAGDEAEPEAPEETADEVRVRLNREHLDRIKEAARKQMEEEEGDGDGDEDREEKEGRRDSLVAEILQRNQLEESGRALRSMASRVLKPEPIEKFRLLVKHRKSVTAVALGEDDRRGFSASKDGTILHWDVESGKKEKYLWPSEDVLISHYAKATQNLSKKRSNNTLALAVSSDGRYLVSGGLDRHIHLWDTRTRGHIQAFHGHRGPVSCLAFRQRTPQLFSGSFDRTIKLWNVEDRTHMDSLFGHQSEILTIDCLHKERPLTVGRDRTMRLWTITEGKHAKFEAAASSFECSCFISDNDILSGSDDGSIKFWTTKSRKPTHIVKNAHTPLLPEENMGIIPNGGQTENGVCITGSYSAAQSWVSSVAVCRGSDLAASGAANGVVRLWAIESNEKSIRPLCSFPLVGFVNSLAFAKSGRFLLAGVGQEHRLGTWERVRTAENGVAIHSIKLKEDRKHSL